MPVNRAEPLTDLRAAMDAWPAGDRLPILVEYVLIPGVNNAPGHANEVADFLAGLSVNLNVIPYNPIRDSPWPAPTESEVIAFAKKLETRAFEPNAAAPWDATPWPPVGNWEIPNSTSRETAATLIPRPAARRLMVRGGHGSTRAGPRRSPPTRSNWAPPQPWEY